MHRLLPGGEYWRAERRTGRNEKQTAKSAAMEALKMVPGGNGAGIACGISSQWIQKEGRA
jgi:hypothetical protein